jgi:hypothetical protein
MKENHVEVKELKCCFPLQLSTLGIGGEEAYFLFLCVGGLPIKIS